MKKFILLSAIIALNLISHCFAQKQANKWYFGQNSALDFSSGSPVAISGSAINTYEGCASIADAVTGNLLFYTDGTSVWDKTNTQMPNGDSLWGSFTSTQAGVIVQ